MHNIVTLVLQTCKYQYAKCRFLFGETISFSESNTVEIVWIVLLFIELCSAKRAIKEKKKSILFSFSTRQFSFLFTICFAFISVLFFFCALICVFDVFLFCADTFENRPFYPSSSSFMFYSRSSCFTNFLSFQSQIFFDSTNTYSRTHVLFFFMFACNFFLSFCSCVFFSAEMILMEFNNFIGCIFHGI